MTRAEELGFESVWMEEHHAVVDHYWPSPLTVLAGFATRTARMTLGTDILVAPFYHPVRLAEDVAMLDVMSGGRFILGLAIGYKPDEFALYGAEAREARRALRGAAGRRQGPVDAGIFQWKGAHYSSRAGSSPSPSSGRTRRCGSGAGATSRSGAPPRWPTTGSPGPTADLARLLAGKQRFLDNRRAAGRAAPIAEWPLTRDVIIADTDREARELAERHIMVSYRKEYAGGWKHPFIDARSPPASTR